MEKKERELNCWNHSVLERLKREIVTNKLRLNILLDFARKPIIHKEKNRHFRRLPRSKRFGKKVLERVTQVIALNKPFVFLVPLLRLYCPTYDTNL